MRTIFLLLLVLSLLSFSYEKTKKECETEFFGCNFKCGFTHDKDDDWGLATCMDKCQKARTSCLNTATK
jgi:hypothetical protein